MKPDLSPSEVARSAGGPRDLRKRSLPLDGIRAIAALTVVLSHCAAATGILRRVYLYSPVAGRLVGMLGNFAVTTFFALSAMLLFGEFTGRVLYDRPAPRLRIYAAKRALRIYPAYWVALVGFALLAGTSAVHGSIFGLVTLLERNLNASREYPGLWVSWTLYIEVSFYVFLPILVFVLARACRARPTSTRIRIVTGTLLGLSLFSFLWAALTHHLPYVDLRLERNLMTFLSWFVAGMLLALAQRCHREGDMIWPRISQLADHPWVCWGAALGINILLAIVGWEPFVGEGRTEFLLRVSLHALGAFLLLLPFALSSRPSVIRTSLKCRPLVWISLVSYGLYLWHWPLINELTRHLTFTWSVPSYLLMVAIILPSGLLIGWVSHRLIELPALGLVHSRSDAVVAPSSDR